MLCEKITDGRTVAEGHVVADVIAAFEQQPLLRTSRLVVNPLGLFDWYEILGAVDN
jgi:hypothetical protein